MSDSSEDHVWKTLDPDYWWILDKLILSKKLGYKCGPTGISVDEPGNYIVRPCVNAIGLGLGAQKLWIEGDTTNLPLGYFWCEWFDGRHLSVDYNYGSQTLCVEGFKTPDTFTRWNEWKKTNDVVELPNFLKTIAEKFEWVNAEFIGDKLIEFHFRSNDDFAGGINHFIPVWEGQDTTPPDGYFYKSYPDLHGRIGAFVK